MIHGILNKEHMKDYKLDTLKETQKSVDNRLATMEKYLLIVESRLENIEVLLAKGD